MQHQSNIDISRAFCAASFQKMFTLSDARTEEYVQADCRASRRSCGERTEQNFNP